MGCASSTPPPPSPALKRREEDFIQLYYQKPEELAAASSALDANTARIGDRLALASANLTAAVAGLISALHSYYFRKEARKIQHYRSTWLAKEIDELDANEKALIAAARASKSSTATNLEDVYNGMMISMSLLSGSSTAPRLSAVVATGSLVEPVSALLPCSARLQSGIDPLKCTVISSPRWFRRNGSSVDVGPDNVVSVMVVDEEGEPLRALMDSDATATVESNVSPEETPNGSAPARGWSVTGCSISDTSAEVRVQLSADCDDHSLLRITIGGQALQPLLAEATASAITIQRAKALFTRLCNPSVGPNFKDIDALHSTFLSVLSDMKACLSFCTTTCELAVGSPSRTTMDTLGSCVPLLLSAMREHKSLHLNNTAAVALSTLLRYNANATYALLVNPAHVTALSGAVKLFATTSAAERRSSRGEYSVALFTLVNTMLTKGNQDAAVAFAKALFSVGAVGDLESLLRSEPMQGPSDALQALKCFEEVGVMHEPEGAEEAASLLMIQRVFLATKSFSRYDAQSTVSSEDVQRLFSLSCSRLPLDCAVAARALCFTINHLVWTLSENSDTASDVFGGTGASPLIRILSAHGSSHPELATHVCGILLGLVEIVEPPKLSAPTLVEIGGLRALCDVVCAHPTQLVLLARACRLFEWLWLDDSGHDTLELMRRESNSLLPVLRRVETMEIPVGNDDVSSLRNDARDVAATLLGIELDVDVAIEDGVRRVKAACSQFEVLDAVEKQLVYCARLAESSAAAHGVADAVGLACMVALSVASGTRLSLCADASLPPLQPVHLEECVSAVRAAVAGSLSIRCIDSCSIAASGLERRSRVYAFMFSHTGARVVPRRSQLCVRLATPTDPTMPWSLGPPLDPSHMGIEKGGKLVVYVPKAAIPSDGVCVCISVSGVNVAVSPILTPDLLAKDTVWLDKLDAQHAHQKVTSTLLSELCGHAAAGWSSIPAHCIIRALSKHAGSSEENAIALIHHGSLLEVLKYVVDAAAAFPSPDYIDCWESTPKTLLVFVGELLRYTHGDTHPNALALARETRQLALRILSADAGHSVVGYSKMAHALLADIDGRPKVRWTVSDALLLCNRILPRFLRTSLCPLQELSGCLIPALTSFMSSSYRVAVAGVSSLTIAAQSQHGSDCTRVAVVNGLPLVLQAMNAHASHPAVVRECLKALEVMLLATNSCGDVINELAGESSLPQGASQSPRIVRTGVVHSSSVRTTLTSRSSVSLSDDSSGASGSENQVYVFSSAEALSVVVRPVLSAMTRYPSDDALLLRCVNVLHILRGDVLVWEGSGSMLHSECVRAVNVVRQSCARCEGMEEACAATLRGFLKEDDMRIDEVCHGMIASAGEAAARESLAWSDVAVVVSKPMAMTLETECPTLAADGRVLLSLFELHCHTGPVSVLGLLCATLSECTSLCPPFGDSFLSNGGLPLLVSALARCSSSSDRLLQAIAAVDCLLWDHGRTVGSAVTVALRSVGSFPHVAPACWAAASAALLFTRPVSDLQPLEILDLIQRVSGIPPSRIQIGHVRCLLAMLDNTQSILWSSLGKPFRHSWEYYLAKHQRAVVRGICTTLTSVAEYSPRNANLMMACGTAGRLLCTLSKRDDLQFLYLDEYATLQAFLALVAALMPALRVWDPFCASMLLDAAEEYRPPNSRLHYTPAAFLTALHSLLGPPPL